MPVWLTGFLTELLKPIIKDIIGDAKNEIIKEIKQHREFTALAKEDDETIQLAQAATTTEEVKAHLRRLKSHRAILGK